MKPLREIAVDECRGEASDADVARLREDLAAWSDALVDVIDDVDEQLRTRRLAQGPEPTITFLAWEKRARWFRTCLSERLNHVERLRARDPWRQLRQVATRVVEAGAFDHTDLLELSEAVTALDQHAPIPDDLVST